MLWTLASVQGSGFPLLDEVGCCSFREASPPQRCLHPASTARHAVRCAAAAMQLAAASSSDATAAAFPAAVPSPLTAPAPYNGVAGAGAAAAVRSSAKPEDAAEAVLLSLIDGLSEELCLDLHRRARLRFLWPDEAQAAMHADVHGNTAATVSKLQCRCPHCSRLVSPSAPRLN